jgi:hypothetical protein
MIVASTVEKIEKALSNMPNFDINVYKYSDDLWRLCPYTLVETDNGTATGREMHHLHMEIDEEEFGMLGLDFEDDDIWVSRSELEDATQLPGRVGLWVMMVENAIDKQTAKV